MTRHRIALAMLLAACGSIDAARVARERIALEIREASAGEHRMNVTADLTDAVVDTIRHHFATRLKADVYGIWTVPGKPDRHVVFAQPPSEEKRYGPRIYVIRQRFGRTDVLHAGPPMMDADYLDPAFFGDGQSVLLLADFGSEDSWGLEAIHIADGDIRALGAIEVTGPAGESGFIESALPVARVFVEQGRYVVTFDAAVFVEKGNRFRSARTE